MVALVDCNNFYASCERLFKPELKGKPIIVLSNNDGCVIARSNEAKDLGITMGAVFHMIQEEIKNDKINVFSSNYTLYGDMSARVMTNLARFSPEVEVYSIDECFLGLTGVPDLEKYAHEIRNSVIQNTGIPVSVGIAPTKTLAKLANKMCKRTGGVCVLDTPDKITDAVKDYQVEDLWGIGRAYAKQLILLGIETAADLRNQPIGFVQDKLTIQGIRMWNELWGRSCIPLSDVQERKKGLCTSRAFSKLTDSIEELSEATASYANRLSLKLRKDQSCATVISVRLLTNRFKTDQPQAFPAITISLTHPANSTSEIVKVALAGLRAIYREGFMYQKVEVTATGLIPETEVQLNMFSHWNGPKNDKLSKIMDQINAHYGRGTIKIATEGTAQKWAMKRNYLSPAYTTQWKDIIKTK
jgi:DNA polymerase V